MATYVFPAVMSKGVVAQALNTATTNAGKVWVSTAPTANARGFLMKASSGNASSIFIGSSTVTTTTGLDLAANDVLAGAIDGAGATEIYQRVAGAGPTYVILEIG